MSYPAGVSEEVYAGRTAPAKAAAEAVRDASSRLVALFAATLFLSAFLMFLVEPMIAKMVLPLLGGAPAVWNTCLVFFQTMLLGGYAYAHGATAYLGTRRHIVVHSMLLLVPLVGLPFVIQPGAMPASGGSPVLWLLLVLFTSIGLPFFVLSTSAAVLQKWFSSTDDANARDPYFLYAASNVGSFMALIAYPALVEPTLRLRDQARLWTAGYVVFVALSAVCAMAVWRRAGASADRRVGARATSADETKEAAPATWGTRARWLALAFVPSSLLLAVTNYISTNIASVPLLWIVPLALYLMTFVVAFRPAAVRVRAAAGRAMPLLVVLLTLVLVAQIAGPLWLVIPLHLLTFFASALVCHGALADGRPGPSRLTEFYFWIALGGMLGGLFNTLIAPVVFVGIAEYPLVLVLACLLRPALPPAARRSVTDLVLPLVFGALSAGLILLSNRMGAESRWLVPAIGLPALFCYSQSRRPLRFAACIGLLLLAGQLAANPFGRVVYAERTFFGVYQVRLDPANRYRWLFHGTTVHGMQRVDERRSHEPLSYFHRTGPVGQVFAGLPRASEATDVAVVGLGVGSLASYAGPAQRWTFYEIDPAVERIARNASYFGYLRDCGDRCRVVIGDARLSLASARPEQYGLIVLDAFSSDAIPMHLMTREAMALYVSRLAPGGAIAFHISNMHLALSPVLARVADAQGLTALWQREPPTAGSIEVGKFPSEWMVFARTRADLGTLPADARWVVPPVSPAVPLWTDDFSNILSVLKTRLF